MNCNCLKDIQERIKERGDFKKPVEHVENLDTGFILEGKGAGFRTVSHIEITLEGQKKKEKISMMHNFCPFCGEPQNVDKSKEVVESAEV